MLKKLKSLFLGGPPPEVESRSSRRKGKSKPREASDEAGGNDESSVSEDGRLAHGMPGEFERVFGRDEVDSSAWIGVDLDGTLSVHTEDIDIHKIGPPVRTMVARVQDWIGQGYVVKILTARASLPEGIPPVKKWLKENGLPELEVTCEKDLHMIELWDDRGVQVIANTGQPVGPSSLDAPEEEEPEDEEPKG
ncbi:hypothetical protein [Rubellicoccus peritrichatus]|uniref:Polynucleotide kinase n=1 Tax=Rubellicoccus peritrichatus TaxID=3080537 RepID=A0AAQ3LAX4_9BACT|nr:hypothetical protein [Puniceicoccus sp. CR14]WOO42485.1 hypothetical protein RZN69_05240 [Puniceicoccus sp. CR14]